MQAWPHLEASKRGRVITISSRTVHPASSASTLCSCDVEEAKPAHYSREMFKNLHVLVGRPANVANVL